MANRIISIMLGASLLLLSSCVASKGGEEYATPLLFLDHAVNQQSCTIYSSVQGDDSPIEDPDFVVRDLLKVIRGYKQEESIRKREGVRYFTYRILISHATTGPNYSSMTVYEDGGIEIIYKQSLGMPVSYFHSLDPGVALDTNDFVETTIETATGIDYPREASSSVK